MLQAAAQQNSLMGVLSLLPWVVSASAIRIGRLHGVGGLYVKYYWHLVVEFLLIGR